MLTLTHHTPKATASVPFTPLYLDPTDHGLADLPARRLWLALTDLRLALSPEGLTWLAERTTTVPDNGYGKLPGRRRLWNSDGPLRPLHASDAFIGIACGDDGQASEIWAAPGKVAYMRSRNCTENDAEVCLFEAWERILDLAAGNSGSSIVIGFAVDGHRETDLDLE